MTVLDYFECPSEYETDIHRWRGILAGIKRIAYAIERSGGWEVG